ncbi:hypothetical protein [Halalkaliarchaeum desulfuricum]|uniref:hypothetical protein n=1 Tax=Halalkaliarchaeum desulfuricum TaxID=2055893 RepID=UPI00105AB09C|nr:hypothetical protein [Halalkaliarchaeum desulfuricum]
MATQYDALCEKYNYSNGNHTVSFLVEAPPDKPRNFTTTVSDSELDQLREYSVNKRKEGTGIGWVPVIYNNGWEIDWDSLESYSY